MIYMTYINQAHKFNAQRARYNNHKEITQCITGEEVISMPAMLRGSLGLCACEFVYMYTSPKSLCMTMRLSITCKCSYRLCGNSIHVLQLIGLLLFNHYKDDVL